MQLEEGELVFIQRKHLLVIQGHGPKSLQVTHVRLKWVGILGWLSPNTSFTQERCTAKSTVLFRPGEHPGCDSNFIVGPLLLGFLLLLLSFNRPAGLGHVMSPISFRLSDRTAGQGHLFGCGVTPLLLHGNSPWEGARTSLCKTPILIRGREGAP